MASPLLIMQVPASAMKTQTGKTGVLEYSDALKSALHQKCVSNLLMWYGWSQELSCSLRKTNPGVSLTIMAVEGDLSSNTQLELKKHGSLLLVDDIQFANFKLDGR